MLAGQLVHSVEALLALKYPGWHSEQIPTPGTLLARPGGHDWHELSDEPPSVGLKRPGTLNQKKTEHGRAKPKHNECWPNRCKRSQERRRFHCELHETHQLAQLTGSDRPVSALNVPAAANEKRKETSARPASAI